MDALTVIPVECWTQIFEYLNISELSKIISVCSVWYNIINQNVLKPKWSQSFLIPCPETGLISKWTQSEKYPFKNLAQMLLTDDCINHNLNLYQLTFTKIPCQSDISIYEQVPEFDSLQTVYKQLLEIRDNRRSVKDANNRILQSKMNTAIRKAVNNLSELFESYEYQLVDNPWTVNFIGFDKDDIVYMLHIHKDNSVATDSINGLNNRSPFIEELCFNYVPPKAVKSGGVLKHDQDLDYYKSVEYIRLISDKTLPELILNKTPINLKLTLKGYRFPKLTLNSSCIINYNDINKLIKTLAPFGYTHWRN